MNAEKSVMNKKNIKTLNNNRIFNNVLPGLFQPKNEGRENQENWSCLYLKCWYFHHCFSTLILTS